MQILHFVRAAFVAGICVFVAHAALAQSYPMKPIRIYATEIGSASDLSARLIAKELQTNLGQSVVVENRVLIGVELAAQAAPDGYTLLHYPNPLWILPLFRSSVPWDVARDFTPIGMTVFSPNVLVVHPALPVQSVKDLIALAKARPGELNYGSSSTGAGNHVAAELFKSMAGVRIVRIAYKGGSSSLNALVAGEMQLSFPAAATAAGHVRGGKLRALAVTSLEPSALAPGLPTMAASGLPGYESISYTGLFAPAKTSGATVTRLNQEVIQALRVPAIRERLFSAGSEVVASSPSEAAETIRTETERTRKLIADAGLREN
jgi:tripartite-type tricarboxylate transporter receptor subunit TctC